MESAEGLLMKTWEIFSDGHKFREMSFDESIDTRYEVLQELNDDLLIVRRDHRIPTVETTFASIQVMFRLQTPSGYTLCMRTIPAPEIHAAMSPTNTFTSSSTGTSEIQQLAFYLALIGRFCFAGRTLTECMTTTASPQAASS